MNDAAATPDPVAIEPVPVSEESQSLADHEASFARLPNGARPEPAAPEGETASEREERERDAQGRFRHRAQSQKASAEDVAEIGSLTKQLREKERELAAIDPDALSGSPRVLGLKRQIEALDVRLSKAKAPAATAQPAARSEEPLRQTVTLRAKPTEDEIGTKYATYGDYVEDLTDWKAEQRDATRAAASQASQQQAQHQAIVQAHNQRLAAFAKTTPDFETIVQPFIDGVKIPALLGAAVMLDDNGAQYVYHLAKHPALVDELYLLTDGKDVNESNVAIVQRRLKEHAQAATTGSAATARPLFIPPKPPNPVRTGPIRTGDDLPGDESSLAAHEAAFSRRRR